MILTKTPPEGAIKWLAFGCTHAPLQDKSALDVVIERIREYKPDVVIQGGDLFEADSASRWPSEYDWTWNQELWSACNEVLKPIREAAHDVNPNAEMVFLPGNHCYNVLEIGRHDPKVRESLDWRVRQYTKNEVWLNEELLTHWSIPTKYDYSRSKGVFRIGAVSFFHGYESNASSDEFQSITMGWPMGLTVSFHTHRPTPGEPRRAMRTKTLPLDRWYLNGGCTRKMECGYMKRKRQVMWGQALVYGWSKPINSPRFSKTWDAYCELIKWFDD